MKGDNARYGIVVLEMIVDREKLSKRVEFCQFQ